MTTETAAASPGIAARAKGWAALARIPFLSVGVMPYWLGMTIAKWQGHDVNGWVYWLGMAGVVLIMLATYFNGEWSDIVEDRVSGELGRSQFAGGSGAVADGILPPAYARRAAYVVTALAVIDGLVIWLVFGTGWLTVPLGIFGLIAGFYYSARPLRWVERGIGEILIGICYGWLPIAIGYYLQAGELPALLLWVSLPVAFTIFNVIFDNEYPDYQGDLAAGKRNLLVRIGEPAGVWVYIAATVLGWATFAWSFTRGVPSWVWPYYAGVAALSLVPCVMFALGKWKVRKLLEPMLGITIVVNLATTAVYIAAFWSR